MCLICEFRPRRDDVRYEKRVAEFMSAIVKGLQRPDDGRHLADWLITQGFTIVEIKDMRAIAMVVLAQLEHDGLISLEPAIGKVAGHA